MLRQSTILVSTKPQRNSIRAMEKSEDLSEVDDIHGHLKNIDEEGNVEDHQDERRADATA